MGRFDFGPCGVERTVLKRTPMKQKKRTTNLAKYNAMIGRNKFVLLQLRSRKRNSFDRMAAGDLRALPTSSFYSETHYNTFLLIPASLCMLHGS